MGLWGAFQRGVLESSRSRLSSEHIAGKSKGQNDKQVSSVLLKLNGVVNGRS